MDNSKQNSQAREEGNLSSYLKGPALEKDVFKKANETQGRVLTSKARGTIEGRSYQEYPTFKCLCMSLFCVPPSPWLKRMKQAPEWMWFAPTAHIPQAGQRTAILAAKLADPWCPLTEPLHTGQEHCSLLLLPSWVSLQYNFCVPIYIVLGQPRISMGTQFSPLRTPKKHLSSSGHKGFLHSLYFTDHSQKPQWSMQTSGKEEGNVITVGIGCPPLTVTAAVGPALMLFTLSFIIANLLYTPDMRHPGSTKSSSTEKALNCLLGPFFKNTSVGPLYCGCRLTSLRTQKDEAATGVGAICTYHPDLLGLELVREELFQEQSQLTHGVT
ncbi:hypothetical protein HPG69_014726 [Diceros bicornis minor]|uniref:SEA domain-containing protein n=1 Tax=Diceros bicornis minor TaxID=77932 RepID=A0A7J7EY41_DICBM|nr:hypothetical protein HPG69_014726 [Diceros bicornis minor]